MWKEVIIVQQLNSYDSWNEIKTSIQTVSSQLSINPSQDNKATIHCYNTSTASRLCSYADWTFIGNHKLKFLPMNTITYSEGSKVSSYGGWIFAISLSSLVRELLIYV